MTGTDRAYRSAIKRLRMRDVAGAERLLQIVVDLDPDHAGALHHLGLLAGRNGRDAECLRFLTRAIASSAPRDSVKSRMLLAAAHRRALRWSQAEGVYREVLRTAPDSTDALLELGILLGKLGRYPEAISSLRKAVSVAPHLAVAHGLLAKTLDAAGEIVAAAESAERALALEPTDFGFAADLAILRNAQGRFIETEEICRKRLETGDDARLQNALGIARKARGRLDEAERCFERAAEVDPQLADPLYNLAALRKDMGLADDAVAIFREVVRRFPELAAAHIGLCMAHLPSVYADQEEVERRRSDYSREMDALTAYADRVGAAKLAPGVGAAQSFLLSYQGGRDVDLQRQYGTLMCRAMAEAMPPAVLAGRPAPGERIRVGIVSGHIRDHSVWRLPTRGWVEGLDRSRFEIIVYHTSAERDSETDRAQRAVDRFEQGPFSTERWREKMAADQPHALIYPEIGMDPMVARLAAMRLAPVQFTSWGHPVTSGYPTIDFFLSSADMEPADGDRDYTERLIRLPGLSTVVELPVAPKSVTTRGSLGLPSDAVVYWCGQSLAKYAPAFDHVFSMIADRVSAACFVFVEASEHSRLTERFWARLKLPFVRRGLDPARHCVFLPRMTPDGFRAAMGCADVVLDSIGWSGCNTLLEALALRLPIVTMPGDTMRSRHGAAILGRIGRSDLVARDIGEYVKFAVGLGQDRNRGTATRGHRASHVAALNDVQSIGALENAILASVIKNTRWAKVE